MQKTVLSAAFIIAAALIFSVYLSTEGKRYDMETANNLIYRLDRKTGMLWLIFGGQVKPVGVSSGAAAYSSESDEAISLAQKSKALGGGHAVDEALRKFLENKKGPLTIDGWSAEKKEDKVYLVSYRFTEETGPNGFFFEVNLVARIVRSVLGDAGLEKKYSLKEIGDKNRHRVLNNILSQQFHKDGI